MSGATSEASSSAATAAAGTAATGQVENRSGASEGPSSSARRPSASTTRTLDDVMREPSATVPDVVVLESLPEDSTPKDTIDPKEDLWLSTVDGRYSSPVIPLRVHKHVLLKSEYFQKALCGEFRESESQSIDLPEEDPAIFHFLVAYLYEGKYEPIKPAASVLISEEDKGKANATADDSADSDQDSTSSIGSDLSARSQRRHDRRRRRNERHWERMRQKHPGMHRPNCNCPTCTSTAFSPPCWSCRAPRNPSRPPGRLPLWTPGFAQTARLPQAAAPRRRHGQPQMHPIPTRRYGSAPGSAAAAAATLIDPNGGRITDAEDLRTWLLAYELNIDVYILANKFLLAGFKAEIARCAVDMLEARGRTRPRLRSSISAGGCTTGFRTPTRC
ncbi:hypothetical protein N0V88_004716 [Collariella sp. IMI 366227]|nr:hypothetical protein N0V88_004716 [Collariella sp. IMI 366227]